MNNTNYFSLELSSGLQYLNVISITPRKYHTGILNKKIEWVLDVTLDLGDETYVATWGLNQISKIDVIQE